MNLLKLHRQQVALLVMENHSHVTRFQKEGFENGRTLKRWERSRYDAQTQLRHTENRYELIEDGEVIYTEEHRRSPELRNYSVAQLSALMEDAGYVGVHALKDYSDEPAGEEDALYFIFGKKRVE